MAAPKFDHLTPRERDCLRLVGEGRSSKEIAKALNISPHTVNEYVRSAVGKLGAENRRAAARQLVAEEAAPSPELLGDKPPEVAPDANFSASAPGSRETGGRHWRLPFLRQGRQFNDLTALQRLGWIVLGAVAIVILFSQLSQGMLVIQSMFRGR